MMGNAFPRKIRRILKIVVKLVEKRVGENYRKSKLYGPSKEELVNLVDHQQNCFS